MRKTRTAQNEFLANDVGTQRTRCLVQRFWKTSQNKDCTRRGLMLLELNKAKTLHIAAWWLWDQNNVIQQC